MDEIIVETITDIAERITQASLVNLSYADVRAVMNSGGFAAALIGESRSQDKARDVVRNAFDHPLLEIDYRSSNGAFLCITGGLDLTLKRAEEIAKAFASELDPQANIIWGARAKKTGYEDRVRIMAIMTGMQLEHVLGPAQTGSLNSSLQGKIGQPIDTKLNMQKTSEGALRQCELEKQRSQASPRILVVGCGGAGINITNTLFGLEIKDTNTIAIDIDKLHLDKIDSDTKVFVGADFAKGLGTDGDPEIGRRAAELGRETLEAVLGEGEADLVFITAGLGGGAGTGIAPIVAQIAKAQGATVVAVVSTPFRAERRRVIKAEEGLEELRREVGMVVVLDYNRLSVNVRARWRLNDQDSM
ncbi:MAG: hypothetical protein ACXV7G_11035 [Halobacteriota archaeon]